MSNKDVREYKEMKNLFADPKFFRQALKSLGQAIALQPASRPIVEYDEDGQMTRASQIEDYSYRSLCKDIQRLGKEDREPTELEMILHCQMIKARFDTSAATFIRDTLGAKPIDESKLDASVHNPYEELTDEELAAIATMRAAKQLAPPEAPPQVIVESADKEEIRTFND